MRAGKFAAKLSGGWRWKDIGQSLTAFGTWRACLHCWPWRILRINPLALCEALLLACPTHCFVVNPKCFA